jgi:uncharacterized protein with HEPN domain
VSLREWQVYIEDIVEAVDRIMRYSAPLTAETFGTNTLVVDAVVRNFTVIGEAARNVPPQVEERYPHVAWAKMRGMRNVVVHVYFSVDVDIVWDAATPDPPPLVAALRVILAENQ